MTFLNIFIGAWNALTNTTSGGPSTEALQVALLDLAWITNDWINSIYWSLDRITQWWNGTSSLGEKINVQMGNAMQNVDWMLLHIVDTIIPQTIAYELGKQKKVSLSDLYHRVKLLWQANTTTQRRINNLWAHINKYVNPADARINQIYPWYTHTAIPLLYILQDWVKAPALLAAKLTPWMAPDLIQYWSMPANRLSTERLLELLLVKAPLVTGKIDQAAVAVLNSGRYPAG